MSNHNKIFDNFSSHKKVISGEVFKEPFMDIFLTNLEQTAFSLIISKQRGALLEAKQSFDTFCKAKPSKAGYLLQSQNKNAFGKNKRSVKTSFLQAKDQKQSIAIKDHQHLEGLQRKYKNQNKKYKNQKLVNSKSISIPGGVNFPNFISTRIDKPLTAKLFGVKIANYVNCGDSVGAFFGKSANVGRSGKIIKISKKQIVVQKTQVLLFYSEANVHVKQGDWVKRGAPILTLTNNTLITGDIVQGIPRIEQLFEAPNAPPSALRTGEYVYTSLHSQIREIFRKNWLTAPLPVAVRSTLQEMQQILIESIQKVYLSQGVLIADKHVEIVVSQMTNKAQIIDSGSTGLFLEEVLSLREIENANLATPGKKALYVPTVIGLTKSALHSDSFLSAASFQETSRVLSRDAIIGKSDFLRGLKEKVVVGDIIAAGTGLDAYFVYTLLSNKQFSHLLKYPDFLHFSLKSS